jgi:osmotically-inducible protein OsmY
LITSSSVRGETSPSLAALLALVMLATGVAGCTAVVVAGGATATVAATDRRTLGAQLDDQTIEIRAASAIRSDPALKGQVHVNVTSMNGTALITGETPSAEQRDRVLMLVRDIAGVRRTMNELRVAAPSTSGERSHDAWLTTKVKSKLAATREIESWHIKVVTENEVVYLMGLVNRAQGELAAEATRTVGGVSRVVKLFEYLD